MPLLRPQRSPRDFLTDSALTLAFYYLCGLVAGRGMRVGDRLTATKLVFFIAYPWYRRGVKGFNFTFQKYTHGPFTRELYETWGDLEWAGFLDVPTGPSSISLTEEGVKLAQSFITDVLVGEENKSYLLDLLATASKHARQSTNQVLRDCYQMEVVCEGSPDPISVREVPEGAVLTEPLHSSDVKAQIEVPDRWLVQFDIQRHINVSQGTAYEAIARLHTPELAEEIAANLEALDRGEGKRISGQELLEELHFG